MRPTLLVAVFFGCSSGGPTDGGGGGGGSFGGGFAGGGVGGGSAGGVGGGSAGHLEELGVRNLRFFTADNLATLPPSLRELRCLEPLPDSQLTELTAFLARAPALRRVIAPSVATSLKDHLGDAGIDVVENSGAGPQWLAASA